MILFALSGCGSKPSAGPGPVSSGEAATLEREAATLEQLKQRIASLYEQASALAAEHGGSWPASSSELAAELQRRSGVEVIVIPAQANSDQAVRAAIARQDVIYLAERGSSRRYIELFGRSADGDILQLSGRPGLAGQDLIASF
jgi:hypothetical protein